jgi:hypothetical protein
MTQLADPRILTPNASPGGRSVLGRSASLFPNAMLRGADDLIFASERLA